MSIFSASRKPDEEVPVNTGVKKMGAYEIKSGIPRPANLPQRLSGDVKYPIREMQVDQFFEVPKEDFIPGEPFDPETYDAKKLRNRVNQAVRTVALKMNKEEEAKEGFNPETFVPVRYTVAILENQNIGVWRDS